MAGDYAVYEGDAVEFLAALPANYAQVCMTSPPYWGLRDYGTGTWEGGDPGCDHKPGKASRVGRTSLDGGKGTQGHQQEGYAAECPKCGAVRKGDQQIGLEDTPDEYVDRLVQVFRGVRRVLRSDGIAVVVLGDTYVNNRSYQIDGTKQVVGSQPTRGMRVPDGLKPKDLVGIPWRVALAMQRDGWYLRHALPWVKLNAMPNSQADRPTATTETVFVFSKSAKYYWDQDAVRVRSADGTAARTVRDTDFFMNSLRAILAGGRGLLTGAEGNPLAVVTNTAKFPQAHYATFPEELVEPFLRAGTSSTGCCPKCGKPWVKVVRYLEDTTPPLLGLEMQDDDDDDVPRAESQQGTKDRVSHLGQPAQQPSADIRGRPQGKIVHWQPGCRCLSDDTTSPAGAPDDGRPLPFDSRPCVVLDPFAGSGTVGAVARGMGLHFIGVELNPDYAAMARQRIGAVTPPLPGLITW